MNRRAKTVRKKSIPIRLCGWAGVGFMAVLTLTAPAHAQIDPPKNYALLIGINQYQSPVIQNLRFAVDDAEALEIALVDAGYVTVRLPQRMARREKIVGELAYLARQARPEDSVLIYFAGHGLRKSLGINEYTYWIVHDTTLEGLEVNGLRLSHVMDYINDIPARRKIVLLDHCHSGRITLHAQSTGGRGGGTAAENVMGRPEYVMERNLFSADDFRHQVEKRVAQGLVILGAARDEAFAYTDLEHGLFTDTLLKALTTSIADADQDGTLSVNELRAYLPDKVADLADTRGLSQVPVDIMRGQNLNWDLIVLRADSNVLRALLATLERHGGLDFGHRVRCIEAVANWENAQATPGLEASADDQDIVEQLVHISELPASLPLGEKAGMLADYLVLLGGGS